MVKVAVLMSTYNGEKYIREQIDSILAQEGEFELKLIVRDDGSKDSTVEILKEYEFNNKIEFYQGKNSGPAKSFMELLCNNAGYDFYAFADQDDYWPQDKIQNGLNFLAKDTPELYFSNGMVVDEKLNYHGNNVYKKRPSTDFNTILCAGGLLGCTMIFNDKLASIIVSHGVSENMVMHDFYLALICQGVGGKIIYDDSVNIKYRQHGENVVGVSSGIMGKIKDRISSVTKKAKVSVAQQAKDILDSYDDVILENNKTFLNKVANYKKNIWTRISMALSLKTRYVNMNKSLTMRMALLLGNR